jgi:predicted RNA methylase
MTDEYKKIKSFIEEKFKENVDNLIKDPELEYHVREVEVVNLRSMTGEGTKPVFNIRVTTNNRAQLLGQTLPFKNGDHVGRFVNLYRGRLIEAINRDIDPNYSYSINFDVATENESTGYVDRYLTVEEAINEGILKQDDILTQKMKEYNLSHLILAGSTIITGPLAGGMENLESICEEYDFESVLDLFCGSGAYSRIASEYGATEIKAVDIDTSAAEPNLSNVEGAEVVESDVFDYNTESEVDLLIADPFYGMSPQFIDEKLPAMAERADYLFMTIASNGHWYWEQKILNLLSDHVEIQNKHNTGRIIQIFGEI